MSGLEKKDGPSGRRTSGEALDDVDFENDELSVFFDPSPEGGGIDIVPNTSKAAERLMNERRDAKREDASQPEFPLDVRFDDLRDLDPRAMDKLLIARARYRKEAEAHQAAYKTPTYAHLKTSHKAGQELKKAFDAYADARDKFFESAVKRSKKLPPTERAKRLLALKQTFMERDKADFGSARRYEYLAFGFSPHRPALKKLIAAEAEAAEKAKKEPPTPTRALPHYPEEATVEGEPSDVFSEQHEGRKEEATEAEFEDEEGQVEEREPEPAVQLPAKRPARLHDSVFGPLAYRETEEERARHAAATRADLERIKNERGAGQEEAAPEHPSSRKTTDELLADHQAKKEEMHRNVFDFNEPKRDFEPLLDQLGNENAAAARAATDAEVDALNASREAAKRKTHDEVLGTEAEDQAAMARRHYEERRAAALMPNVPPGAPLASWLDKELSMLNARKAEASPKKRKAIERIQKTPWRRGILAALAVGFLAGEASHMSDQEVPKMKFEEPDAPSRAKAPEMGKRATDVAPTPLSLSGTVRIEASPQGAARMLVDFFAELRDKDPVVYSELAHGKKPGDVAWDYVRKNGFLKKQGELTLSGVIRPGDHIVMDGFGHVVFETASGEQHLLTDERGNPAKGAVNESWIDYR